MIFIVISLKKASNYLFFVCNPCLKNQQDDIVTTTLKQELSMIAQAIRYCIALSLVVAFGAQADVIKMPSKSPQVITSDSAPVRGMTKNQVESNFGSPMSISGPTGKPAIYRWDYPSYSVFFEHNYVLHSVVTSSN
jgi:hypothetical protein